jgi:hypothetical protein
LETWQEECGTTTAKFLEETIRIQAMNEGHPNYFTRTRESLRHEQKLFRYSGLLYPPLQMLQQEIELQDLLTQYSTKPRGNATMFKKYLTTNWKPNVTFVSREWYREAGSIDLNNNTFIQTHNFILESGNPIQSPNGLSLYDFFAVFLFALARAVGHLKGRMQVEAIEGECTDILERLSFGLVEDNENILEPNSLALSYPPNFPSLYDEHV